MKNKTLLNQDYSDFCKKTFEMPESDFAEYYNRIINEYHSSNPNIIKRLEAAVINWLNWYKTIINFQNETQDIKLNIETASVSLEKYPMLKNSFRTHVNKSFFDKQLYIIQEIATQI